MCSEHAVDEDIVFAWEVICDSAEQVLHDCDEVMYTDYVWLCIQPLFVHLFPVNITKSF